MYNEILFALHETLHIVHYKCLQIAVCYNITNKETIINSLYYSKKKICKSAFSKLNIIELVALFLANV